jgi:hypothetical protein
MQQPGAATQALAHADAVAKCWGRDTSWPLVTPVFACTVQVSLVALRTCAALPLAPPARGNHAARTAIDVRIITGTRPWRPSARRAAAAARAASHAPVSARRRRRRRAAPTRFTNVWRRPDPKKDFVLSVAFAIQRQRGCSSTLLRAASRRRSRQAAAVVDPEAHSNYYSTDA